jgi:hypothetical protein
VETETFGWSRIRILKNLLKIIMFLKNRKIYVANKISFAEPEPHHFVRAGAARSRIIFVELEP